MGDRHNNPKRALREMRRDELREAKQTEVTTPEAPASVDFEQSALHAAFDRWYAVNGTTISGLNKLGLLAVFRAGWRASTLDAAKKAATG